MIYRKTAERVKAYLPVIKNRMYRRAGEFPPVSVTKYSEYSETQTVNATEIKGYPYRFGCQGEDTLFSFTLSVPEGNEDIYLYFPLETDALLTIEGKAESNINPRHTMVCMNPWKGKTIECEVRCWDGYIFPGTRPLFDTHLLTTVGTRQEDYPIILAEPGLLIKNRENFALYYDVLTLSDLASNLPEHSMEREVIFSSLRKALASYPMCSENDEEQSASEVRKKIAPFFEAKNGFFAPSSYSTGMSHLDHAWLWPIRETERKAVRTISGMTALMREYPEFIFLSTQPVQMEYAFRTRPELYEKVKNAFEKGQWEPNGAGLIEADNMLSSGEGLIRNFLYGKQLTEKLFPGYTPDTYVVPDSFGYNGNLPQIMKGCGIEYFITSKLSWNDTNHFPFEKFIWRGIDGSSVKAYMIPGTYNGEITPGFVMSMWDKITNKDVQSAQILTIGEGDGGGGTTRDDIEVMRRIKDIQGCPKASWSKVSDSLRKVFAEMEDVPVYDGELYLELHRGTYTSQARTKQGYRKINTALHNAEYLVASAWAEGKISDSEAEKLNDEVRSLWKQTVVYQFHDILPGSSVHQVYEETEAFFEKALQRLDVIIRSLAGEGDETLNLSPFMQEGIAPYSSGKAKTDSVKWGQVSLSPDGRIESLVYKGREVVSDSFNRLMIGEDVPCSWDAWDIEKDTVDNLRPALARNGKLGKASSINQRAVIHRDKARIDFVTDIDWHEDHQLLKASFDTNIISQNAIFDIPFGFVSRSTGNNNSIEEAQFEVPAQKFVALSDGNVTVAVLSDSKYGYSAKNGTLTVSLLKSAKAPDATADMGKHSFTYSVFVTDGGIGEVIREAEALNNPCIENTGKVTPLITVSDGLSLETVKLSERGGDIIFRVREYLGVPRKGTYSFADCLDMSTLTECMMTEEKDTNVTFTFHPLEVKTYRIRRK